MAIVGELLEGVLGGRGGNGGGGLLAESKEAIMGGCWGLAMSSAFFFLTFATGIALTFGVSELQYQLTWTSAPFVLLFCASGFLSPFVGIMWGLQGGRYSITRHIGCFLLYIIAILAAMFGVSVLL